MQAREILKWSEASKILLGSPILSQKVYITLMIQLSKKGPP